MSEWGLFVPGDRIWEEVVFYSPGGQLAWPQASGFSCALVGDFSFYPGREKKVVWWMCGYTCRQTHHAHPPPPIPHLIGCLARGSGMMWILALKGA